MKNKFSNLNTADVYSEQIQDATTELVPPEIPPVPRDQQPTVAILQAAREQGRTKGRKGCKALRINMAFSPEVHDYIRTMARVRGETITQFTNYIFQKSMEDNAEIYEQAKRFKETL